MFCRRAWQRVGPLAWRAFRPSPRNAPVRHMAFGVPGGSTNMTYVLLCGGGLTAAVVYAYKTVSGDSERYEERLANMGTPAKVSSAPEAAEPAPVEEAMPAIEVVSELVPAPAAAETAAEPVVEAVSEEASEVIIAEAQAEPAVTEEAAPPAAGEEAVPIVVEAAAEVETPAEAPTAESAGMAAVDEVPPAPPTEAETVPAAPEAEAAPAPEVAA